MRRTTGILIGAGNDETRGRNAKRRRELTVSRKWTPKVIREPSAQLSFLEILIKYYKLYCKHSSLVGINYGVYERATKFGRLLWICGYAYICYLAFCYVYEAYLEYLEAPISTSRKNDIFENEDLQFPGVAICSINRISRRAGMELATKMFEANISSLTVGEIYDQIVSLGDLYDTLFMFNDDYSPISELLSKFYNNNYDISDIMEMLTPQCSVMFLVCYFASKEVNCTDIFRLSKTRDGFCCTFNYIVADEDRAKSESGRDPPEIFLAKTQGQSVGLSILMQPFLDDYGYTTVPTTGWKVMVFSPLDYPDPSCGSVAEIFVPPLTRQFIELFSAILTSDDVIHSYSMEKRKCIFSDETRSPLDVYSLNQCIVSCKVDDIWNSCKCRPFFYPRYGHTESSRRTCGVQDILCLRKHNAGKPSVVPYVDEAEMRTIPNKESILFCNHCYYECNDVKYFTDSWGVSLLPGYYDSGLFNGMNVTAESALHVYFTKGGLFLKQDQHYRWYEHLSDVGGIFSFFIGFSIITVVEFIYFLARFLLEVCDFSFTKTEEKDANKKIVVRSVYWKEYFPRPRIDTRNYKGDDRRF